MVFFVTVVADWLYQHPVHYVVASLAFVCPLVMPRRCITSTVGFFLLGTCLGTFPRMMQEMVSSDSAPAPDMMLVALIAQCILILTASFMALLPYVPGRWTGSLNCEDNV